MWWLVSINEINIQSAVFIVSSQYKRYTMYVNVLRGSKLESKLRDKPRGPGRSVESIMLQMKRSSSLGDLDLTTGYKGRNVRESYFMAIYKG